MRRCAACENWTRKCRASSVRPSSSHVAGGAISAASRSPTWLSRMSPGSWTPSRLPSQEPEVLIEARREVWIDAGRDLTPARDAPETYSVPQRPHRRECVARAAYFSKRSPSGAPRLPQARGWGRIVATGQIASVQRANARLTSASNAPVVGYSETIPKPACGRLLPGSGPAPGDRIGTAAWM